MKIKFLRICLIAIPLTFFACKKEGGPVLKGDIKGIVSVIDGYGYSLGDKSNVKVQLSNDKLFMEDSTDKNGQYSFHDIPFGNYHINLIKENYIESILDFRLSHVGGEAPTITSQIIHEIPEYKYAIDSLTYYDVRNDLLFYLRAIDANKPISKSSWFYVHFFFSQSPDVSFENYDNSFVTFIFSSPGNNIFNGDWWWWDVSYNFLNTYSGTIYCRVYPQVYYQEMWPGNDLGPWKVVHETLGKPSEVLSFTLDKITRNF
jgi:hypothetical protein